MTSLEQLRQEIVGLKNLMLRIERELHAQGPAESEDNESHIELADDVVAEIAASKKRKRQDFVSHEAILKRYDSA